VRSNWYKYLLAAIACYSALVWRIGYHFGDGDQEEVLGQILYAQGNTGLSTDFLIASSGGEWSVRTAFVELMSLFSESLLPLAFFISHLLVYLAMFVLIIRIGDSFLSSNWNFFLPLVVVFAFYAHSPGANDLYSAHFISESLGLLFAVLALYIVVSKRYAWLPLILIVCTLFHPLVGIQALVLVIAYWMFSDSHSLRSRSSVLALVNSVIGVGVLTGLFMLKSGGEGVHSYFDLMFRFRNPHHYLPSQFPLMDMVLMVAMFLLTAWMFKRHKGIVAWLGVTLVGMVIYWLGVEVFEAELIAKTQWFKSSIWIRLWFGIALVSFMNKIRVELLDRWTTLSLIVVTLLACGALWMQPGNFSYTNSTDPDLVQIGHDFRKEMGSKEHLVIQPIHITGFQFASHAPLFVSFKSILHYPKFMDKWYDRLTLVYGDFDVRASGFHQFFQANHYYHKLDVTRLDNLRGNGITHILATKELNKQGMDLILQRGTYFIYSIQ